MILVRNLCGRFPFDYADVAGHGKTGSCKSFISLYPLWYHNKNAKLKNTIRYLLVLVFRLTRVKTWNKRRTSYLCEKRWRLHWLPHGEQTVLKFDKSFLVRRFDSRERWLQIPSEAISRSHLPSTEMTLWKFTSRRAGEAWWLPPCIRRDRTCYNG